MIAERISTEPHHPQIRICPEARLKSAEPSVQYTTSLGLVEALKHHPERLNEASTTKQLFLEKLSDELKTSSPAATRERKKTLLEKNAQQA